LAVYRVDYICEGPDPVFKWQRENIPQGQIVRAIAYETVKGWYIKSVFKCQEDAEAFHRFCYPDAEDHTVCVFSWHNKSP
jgi:hypothetical protein